MSSKSRFATISRRDAIRLFATTPASGAVLASSFPIAAVSAAEAVDRAAYPSAGTAASLVKLSAQHFESLVGQQFTIGDDQVMLKSVRRGPESGAGFRQQFALVFAAPRDCPLQSDVLPVSHPAIGRHELHVAQVGGAALEICFS